MNNFYFGLKKWGKHNCYFRVNNWGYEQLLYVLGSKNEENIVILGSINWGYEQFLF